MEEYQSFNSPRRILSYSKRRTTVLFVDPDDKASGFGLSRKHGPKSLEVYGFVGSLATVIATVIFLVCAYVPEPFLHSVGIIYYPCRWWALAVPMYVMVTLVLAVGFYIGFNFMSTPLPTSLNTIFDEFSREPSSFLPDMDGKERLIEPCSDISIDKINVLNLSENPTGFK